MDTEMIKHVIQINWHALIIGVWWSLISPLGIDCILHSVIKRLLHRCSTVPEQAHEPELLGQRIINLVMWVPVIHLLPPGHGGLLEQPHHLHRFRVCRPHDLPEDLGAQSGHAQRVGGQAGHVWGDGDVQTLQVISASYIKYTFLKTSTHSACFTSNYK